MAPITYCLSLAAFLCTAHLFVYTASLPTNHVDNKEEIETMTDGKEKRAQEVIMFGNQQNKPAGMIDDALAAGYFPHSEKKDDDDSDPENVGDESNEEDKPDREESTEEPKEDYVKSENVQVGSDITQKENSPMSGDSAEKNYYEYQKGFKYGLGRDAVSKQTENAVLKSKLYGYPDAWNEYLNFAGGFSRRRRNVHLQRVPMARSVRSTVEDLLRTRRSGRFKRELEIDKEDLLALLALLEAELQAEQKMSNNPLGTNTYRTLSDYDDYGGEEEARIPELEEDENADYDEMLNLPYINPEQRFRLSRRSESYYYPQVDYRYLLLPGQKRSVFRQRGLQEEKEAPGQWGGFLETKRYLPARKRQDTSGARDVYSLAQLLSATRQVDPGVPVYRRPVL